MSQSFVLYMAVANATDAAVNASFKNDTLAFLSGRFDVPDTAHAAITAATNLSALEPGIYISNIEAASFPTPTQAGGTAALNAVAVTFDLVVPLQVGCLEVRGAPLSDRRSNNIISPKRQTWGLQAPKDDARPIKTGPRSRPQTPGDPRAPRALLGGPK